MGWNKGQSDQAGITDMPTRRWDELLADGKQIADSKAARTASTFDAHGWRSLAPITHSISTNVYTPTASSTSPATRALQALEHHEADEGAVGRRTC